MKRDYKVQLEDIISMLNAQWDSLVTELVPNATRHAGYFTVGDIHGNAGKSCVLYRGAKAGAWIDYGGSDDDKGDALILIEKLVTGGDRKEAIKWARQWLGIDDEDEATFKQRKAVAIKKNKEREQQAIADKEKKWKQAKAIFLNADEIIRPTWAMMYYKNRKLDLDLLPRPPRAIRFAEECYEYETRSNHPAIIASITVPNGGDVRMAIHRTFLAPNSENRIDKLKGVDASRKVLGDYRGGYIPIWKGVTGKPLNQSHPDEWCVITEGKEDGIAIAISDPRRRVIAAVSLANMGSLELPDAVKNVMLVKDNDWDNPQAKAAFERAIAWHHSKGRRVRVFSTPANKGKDVNDWISGKIEGGK